MAKGLYRDTDDWVRVEYDDGQLATSIPRIQYVAMGYKPPFDELPSKREYEIKANPR